jgi:hypothetical protein
MEMLKKAAQSMLEMTGLKGEAAQEAIWKSPAVRKALEQQVAAMATKLRTAFTQMQAQVASLKLKFKPSRNEDRPENPSQ